MPTPSIQQVLEQSESTINKAQQFLADLSQARSEIQSAPRNLYQEAETFVTQTRKDVARASALQQSLPFLLIAMGFLLGKPVIGIAAGGAMWYVGSRAAGQTA